ncbi:MAG: DEAD/DEAH box helicase [bacterium]|nr:DEAD/DEAH box helicase [bacterium]
MTAMQLRDRFGTIHNVELEEDKSRLVFTNSPYAFKDEIKAMAGARWTGGRWTIADSPRNHFQLRAMMDGQNPYEWFDRPLAELEAPVERPLKDHQIEMVRKALTYRYQIFAADMGLGKTLTAIEVAERLNIPESQIWFVGPKSALESVQADTVKWQGPGMILKTYERFVIDHEQHLDNPPSCIFFDECSGLKNPNTRRSKAAQKFTDAIRAKHGTDGCVVLLSGTPTAKRPSDIWAQAEIAWPGFLREGSLKAFEQRYAIVVENEDADGNKFKTIVGWKEAEVDKIAARTSGLMSVYRKDELLNLPKRTFIRTECPPNPRTLRVAKALVDSAPNVITGLTWLRALSSGFQYKTDDDGKPVIEEGGERGMVETLCPKDDALRSILDEEEPRGRMIAFASFQGSLDRVKRICESKGWDTIMVDGRGWNCYSDGQLFKQHILEFWANNPKKTVFIGNPASCRFGLTLVEAKTAVVFDQNFSAENRLQSLDRNYRIGQDHPVRVIDLIHLPVDRLILDTLTDNKRLEELSLGLIRDYLN